MKQDNGMLRLVENPALNRRFVRTLQFMRETLPPPARILDLGAPNPFSHIMQEQQYEVRNTKSRAIEL